MVKLNPYLSFRAEARAALEFYQSVLGGELQIDTYAGTPEVADMLADPSEKDLVMHGQLDTPQGLTIMAADTGSAMPYVPATSGVTVALTGGAEDHEYIAGACEQLAEGGEIGVPFEKAPWSDYYGQLTDRFGISWMFDVGTE